MSRTGAAGQWSRWLTGQMRACGYTTDDALAQAIGVSNTTVHRWRKGAHPEVPQLRQLVEPLRTDLRTLLVLSGTLTEREIGGRAGRVDPLTARELLEHDPSLSVEGRSILLAAYDAALETPARQKPTGTARPGTRRAATPSPGADSSLRAVARGGDPEDRAEVRRLARRAREQDDRQRKDRDKQ